MTGTFVFYWDPWESCSSATSKEHTQKFIQILINNRIKHYQEIDPKSGEVKRWINLGDVTSFLQTEHMSGQTFSLKCGEHLIAQQTLEHFQESEEVIEDTITGVALYPENFEHITKAISKKILNALLENGVVSKKEAQINTGARQKEHTLSCNLM